MRWAYRHEKKKKPIKYVKSTNYVRAYPLGLSSRRQKKTQ